MSRGAKPQLKYKDVNKCGWMGTSTDETGRLREGAKLKSKLSPSGKYFG